MTGKPVTVNHRENKPGMDLPWRTWAYAVVLSVVAWALFACVLAVVGWW